MVISDIRIHAQPNLRSQTLEILRSVVGPTLAHPGCLSCRVCEESEPEQAILFSEHWTSSAAFHEHVRSELFRRVLAALELSSQTPEVSIHHVATTEGMDLIKHIRSTVPSAPSH